MIFAGGASIVGLWLYWYWTRQQADDTEADPPPPGPQPFKMFSLELDDTCLREMLQIDHTDDMYVQWNLSSMAETEISHLKSNLTEMQRVCDLAKKSVAAKTVPPCVKKIAEWEDAPASVKVATFAAATWSPSNEGPMVLTPLDQVVSASFRASVCMYYHPRIQADGFEDALGEFQGIITNAVATV